MKRLVLLFCIIFCISDFAYAQFKAGDVELILNAGMGKMGSTREYKGNEDSDSKGYFALLASPAFYIFEGFSLEPEIGLTAVEGAEPALSFLLNASYTYLIPEKQFAVFFKAGYGVSNGYGAFPGERLVIKTGDDLENGVLNLSLGTKILLSKVVIFKPELNFRQITNSESSYTRTYDWLSVLMGFSVLL